MNSLHDDLNLIATNDAHLRQWKPPKVWHHEDMGDAVNVLVCVAISLFAVAAWWLP